ncbi:juvenile hormone acid O-methyltransferase-like [Glandiceps talaboti]
MNKDYKADYLTNSSLQHSAAFEALSLWDDDDWKNDENILDIGCGTGGFTKIIASRDNVQSVVGIDYSVSAINIAKQENSVANKTRYVVADATKLKGAFTEYESSFTKAVSFNTIHWIEDKDHDNVFKNVYWSLKPSSGFVASILIRNPEDTFVTVRDGCLQLPRWTKYLKDFKCDLYPFNGRLEDLNEMVTRNGFRIHRSFHRSLEWKYGCTEKDKALIKTTFKHLDYIPLELHDEFIEDVYQLFCSLAPKDEEGNPYWRIEFVYLKLEK